MPKTITKKKLIRPVHIQAIIFIIIYYIVSYSIFYGSVYHSNIYVSFLVPLVFGLISTFVFLYLFGHQDFFHFMKNIEREERGKERKILGKVGHFGNILACIIVSVVGGPILLSLIIRFLFPKKENKYLIAFVSVLISTIISVSIAKGLFKMIF